jgi:hypothetical protein
MQALQAPESPEMLAVIVASTGTHASCVDVPGLDEE